MNKEILINSLPIWNKLSDDTKDTLISSSEIMNYKKGEIIHKGENACLGLILIKSGKIKAFSSLDGTKKITLYHLYKNDICLFTASCIMKDVSFDIYLECKEDTTLLLIPTEVYKKILESSVIISNYINSIILSRFSDVMWILEQVTFHRLDKRIAEYIVNINEETLLITHEEIANDLGTAREVISRLLKHLEKDNILKLERNKITILNKEKLLEISEK